MRRTFSYTSDNVSSNPQRATNQGDAYEGSTQQRGEEHPSQTGHFDQRLGTRQPSRCGGHGGTGRGVQPQAGGYKKLVIAYNMGAEADPFFIAMNVGAAAEARKLGVTLDWQGDPSVYSPSTQIPIVEEMLAEHPDGLVISPTDPNALQPVVNEAIAEGIPVSNVDTHVTDLSKVLTFITGNNAQGGAVAADAMAKAMHYKAGQTYQVAVGMSSPTTTTNTARLAGFKAEIAKKYPGIKIVAEAYSESQPAKANSNVNDWLTRFPHLKGIFAIDGTNASGASAAIQAHGLVGKVALVGYDAYANNVALLQKGIFVALIAQQPALEGQARDPVHGPVPAHAQHQRHPSPADLAEHRAHPEQFGCSIGEVHLPNRLVFAGLAGATGALASPFG